MQIPPLCDPCRGVWRQKITRGENASERCSWKITRWKKNMKAFIHILSSIDAVCSDLCCGDAQGEGKRSCSKWSVSPTHFLPRLRGLEKTLTHSDCQSYLTAAAFRRCKESCNFTDWTSDPVDSWLIGCWLPLSFLRTKGGIITY